MNMKRQLQNMNSNGITSWSIPPLADLIHIAHHQRLQLLKAFCSSLLLKAVKKLHTWRPYAMSLPMLPVASVCKLSTSAKGCEETSHAEAIHAVPANVASCFSLSNSLHLLKAVKKLHTWRPHALSLPMLQVASVCYAQTHPHKNTFKIQCSWSGSVCVQLLPCKTNTFFCNLVNMRTQHRVCNSFILSSSRESWEKSVL